MSNGKKKELHVESSDLENTDYEVGYKKPPKSKQFKSGQSGNPKGRPKKSKNFFTLLDQALDQEVVVHENGKKTQLSKREAIILRLVNEAASGNMRALNTILSTFDPETDKETMNNILSSDQKIYEQLQKRMTNTSDKKGDNDE